MADEKFHPSLSTLITADSLPLNLGELQGVASGLLDRLFYRNLQTVTSRYGEHARYSLLIVAYERIGFDIPGGLGLYLNPGEDGGTEVPITVVYRWELLRFLGELDLGNFDFSPRAFFDLLLKITRVNYQDLINIVVTDFIGGSLDDFITAFNAKHPATPISVTPDTDVEVYIENLVDALEAESLDILQVLFDDYILDADIPRALANLEKLFRDHLAFYSVAGIERLLIPEFSASIETIAIGVQIPASVLREVDDDGEPVPDPENPGLDKPVLLTVDAASLSYSTKDGLHFDIADDVVISVPRCEVLHSGLTLDIHRIKLDLSRTTNIAEATADGRPEDFIGVYIQDGTISFPAFWKQQSGSTASIKARNLLVGTGGISGTLALEAMTAGDPSPVVKFVLGENFSIAFESFRLTFKQNAITDSEITGTLVVPGFKDSLGNPAEIEIRAAIHANGDFDITAHEDQGFQPIRFPGVFEIGVKSVDFGKKDDDFYLGVSGSIRFTHPLLANLIKEPIEVEKLKIWSDGRFEIEGGTLPLPKTIHFPIGPAELSISAIHLGSHERTNADGSKTKFRYFGFDGGLDVNPGGVDVRGKGIKFYFPASGTPLSDCYLEIKSLAIDLVIPGSASKETATLLISGYLSLGGTGSDPEYEGGVTFALPKVKIAGGASMKIRPKAPAFLVDAFVDLSTPIPLGSTSLGIFGFRGLFGMRYIATKTAAGLDESAAWFDYYKAPVEGLNVAKFEPPGMTAGYDATYSIGAGVTLATVNDSGKAFSSKLFLLLSLPDLIYLEGRANILGERVGLTGTDPPFFAVLAISPQSVELGAGVHYSLPRQGSNKGWILDLNAEMRAAFYFKNASAWFLNVGTVQNPTTARILSLFDASSYLMLSASGIAAGAGVTFGFDKSYAGGLVRASVGVYIKVGGFISFERPQIGGFAMLGGHVNVSLMWLSFYIVIDTSLAVEAARPFYIQGSVHLCVGITIGFWKFKKTISKCFDVEFKWIKDTTVDLAPVLPFAPSAALPPASATNMLSGETFPVAYFGTTTPSPLDALFDDAVLPLDSWVDIEFLKGLLPQPSVDSRIGRLSGQAPSNTIDSIPPAEVAHKVSHKYSIEALEIRAWNGTVWTDYRPYEAMSPPDALASIAANPGVYKDGFWMNTGGGFNKVRLLAETSLSYMQQPGWYVPEEMGITSSTLFCRGTEREPRCLHWRDVSAGTVHAEEKWIQRETILYRVQGGAGTVVQSALAIANDDIAQFVLNEPCAKVRLKLTTFSAAVTIRYYKRETVGAGTAYSLIETRTLTQLQLLGPVEYESAAMPLAKIEVSPVHADPAAVESLQVRIRNLQRIILENRGGENTQQYLLRLRAFEQELERLTKPQCVPDGIGPETILPHIDQLNAQLAQCNEELATLLPVQAQTCKDAEEFRHQFEWCFPESPAEVSCGGPLDCWRTLPVLDDAGVSVRAFDLYCTLYKQLYGRLYLQTRRRLDELKRRCETLTAEVEKKRAECRSLQNQLTAAEEAMISGPVRPPEGFPCATLIHELCWLTVKDHDYNITIPGHDAIENDYTNAVEAIEKRLTPIWRPGTRYSIRLEVRDTVNGSPAPPQTFYFGFRTAGPVGHFHNDPAAKYVKAGKTADQYLLTGLKGYIDYRRSYPNADGELIRSKPLFYEDARILLFFVKRYAYHFFGDWPAYHGLAALTGNDLEIVIKDPAEPLQITATTVLPQAMVDWPIDDEPRLAEDVRTLATLRSPELVNLGFSGGECWQSGGEMIKPASVHVSATPKHLRPLKLYTAIVNNLFAGNASEVHRYVFQTSRYPDFSAQVRSYRLEDSEGNQRDAVFRVEIPLSVADINLMFDIVTGTASAANSALATTWTDPFDRLVEGVLKQPLDAAASTEFNIVRNSTTNAVVGVWIRNPEPFNDPKLPDDVLAGSLHVIQGSTANPAYRVLFSRDRAQAFVMHPAKFIPATQLKFRFAYIEWDGSAHVSRAVVTTSFIPMSV